MSLKTLTLSLLMGAAMVGVTPAVQAASPTGIAETPAAVSQRMQLAQRPYDPSAGSVGFRPYDPSAGSVGFRPYDPSAGSVGFRNENPGGVGFKKSSKKKTKKTAKK
jgi:hypothetical protein